MYITTDPFFKEAYDEVPSLRKAKKVIRSLISAMRKKKTRKVQVTMTLYNGVQTTLVYYREDESPWRFKKRLIKEAKKHL